MDDNAQSGIYAIICENTGKRYIGQASNIKLRWMDHRKTLRAGTHKNRYLQRTYSKHGEESFSFVVVELCDATKLADREDFWINKYSWGRLFNLAPSSKSTLGFKFSPKSRAKLSAALKGRKLSPEHCAKLAETSRNRVWTPEMLANLSAGRRGKKASPELKKKFSEMRKGKPAHPNSRNNLRRYASQPRSPETKKRMSEAWIKIWAQRKLDGYKVHRPTAEQRARMCIAQKKSWVKRKQIPPPCPI